MSKRVAIPLKSYLVSYKVFTKTWPYEGAMVTRAISKYEAIMLTEQALSLRPETVLCRAWVNPDLQ